MCVVWDACEIDITNNTSSPLTLSNSSATTGTWDSSPPSTIAATGGTGSFQGRSTCGNAADGCAGFAQYSLNDGTLVNINYKTSYYYGIDDNSQYSPGFQGARAGQYTNKTNNPVTSSSNGGAGKRVVWTLSIDYAS